MFKKRGRKIKTKKRGSINVGNNQQDYKFIQPIASILKRERESCEGRIFPFESKISWKTLHSLPTFYLSVEALMWEIVTQVTWA